MFPSRAAAPRISLGALLCVAIPVVLLSHGPASATWLANGSPVMPAGPVTADEPLPLSLASDEAGGAFVASGNFLFDARLGRLSGTGSPASGWPADGLFFSVHPYWPIEPAVIADETGGAFVISNVMYCEAHCAGNETELRVQRVTAEGGFEAGWPANGVSIGSDLDRSRPILVVREPVSISNGRGSAFITWARRQSYNRGFSPIELRAQRVDGSGAMPWGPGGIVIHSFASRRYDQAMAPDGNGGVYVFWLDDRAPGLYAQHISEDGKLSWVADGIPVATSPATFTGLPAAIPDGAHGAFVAWAGTSGTGAGVFATRVAPGGALPWRGDRMVFDGGLLHVDGLRMVPTPFDGAIIAWRTSSPGAGDRILAQQIDREGRRRWQQPAAPACEAAGSRDHMRIAADRRGGAYFAWVDGRPAFDVFAMHLDHTGEPARGWTRDGSPVCARLPSTKSPSGFVQVSELELTAIEGADVRGRGKGNDKRDVAREVGALDPEIRVEGNDDEAGRAHDGWPARRDAGAIVVWVDDRYRQCFDCDANGLSPFAMLLAPDGPATAPIVPAPEPVHARTAASSRTTSTPSVLSVRWRSTAGATLALNLPEASPASIELFDVAGRKLWSREVVGPGEQDVHVLDGVCPSGIYVARLAQGGRTATAHVVVIR
jgi:hypothetical protein